MNLKAVAICLILLPFIGQPSREAVAADTALPATLAKALEGVELDSKDGWAFRQTITVNTLDEPAAIEVTRWDPSRPAGERCTVVSVTTADDKADKQDACKKEPQRLLYGELSTIMLKDAIIEIVSDDEATAIYSFVPQGDGHGLQIGSLHLGVEEETAERMIGTLEVAKTGEGAPYVKRAILRLKEPAGNLLARLKHFEVSYEFAPDIATGARLLRRSDVHLGLSVFTMFNVTTEEAVEFDEYRKL
jgi:hypothetical protein